MALKDKLPVSYLLFTSRGRINRNIYWTATIFIWTTFYILFNFLEFAFSYASTWLLYPLLFWALISTAIKRLHDSNKSGHWLWLIFVPLIGPLLLFFFLYFRRGTVIANRFGTVPDIAPDYYKNRDAEQIPHLKSDERIINDITQLNPVLVSKAVAPETIEELQHIVRLADSPISVGGGRFSMGGQTASPHTIHIDMRKLNKILGFSAANRTIKVQAGARWCDIQQYIDPHNLSIKIMQTYANFTVGGSLSVNVHGRYIGLGPLILSVKSLEILLPTGEIVRVSEAERSELFFGCIGCYNAIAIIVAVEFALEENIPVKRMQKKMNIAAYKDYFFRTIRDNHDVVFHNGDIYPPSYKNVRAVSWIITNEKPTVQTRLMPLASAYPVERYFIGAFSKNKFGKLRREYLIDPILYVRRKIHWRNYEAGYDVLELEPKSRKNSTFVLQEYFIPVNKFEDFTRLMSDIFIRHNVNVINVSIRHANKDSGSLLAWAREEVFAFVVYYKQNTDEAEKNRVGVWTRELISAAISLQGSYYLPYQVHATAEQFHKAYPNARKLFELKREIDPHYKFRNVLWDTYYQITEPTMNTTTSKFKSVFLNEKWSDEFYRFLQVIYHLYPEDKLHHLIASTTKEKKNDEEIYITVQANLPKIKPFLSELTYSLPALKKQKKEIGRQILQLLDGRKQLNGYLEIGSTGRYISELRKHITVAGDIFLTNDIAPSNSIADIAERGQIRKLGHFFSIQDYKPISKEVIPDQSIDLVTCPIGLHHCPDELLAKYVQSIHRILRTGGAFIMRDHNVKTPEMSVFVSLAHTVFNLGLNVPWDIDASEFISFKSIDEWSRVICSNGFKDSGKRILQDNDPTDNTLILFTKV